MTEMESSSVPAIRGEAFTLALQNGGSDSVLLQVTGNADLEMLPRLGPFLKQVHSEACRTRADSVTVDLRQLYFMNSSCLKSFITWVVSVSKLQPPSRYRIRFLSNSNLRWQQRSLESMQAFAPGLVDIELAS
jgi:hypothetical protein